MKGAFGHHLSLRKRLLLAFSIPFLVLALIATAYYFALVQVTEGNDALVSQQRVVQLAESYRSNVYLLQGLRRGYLLTGQAVYVEQAEAAVDRARQLKHALSDLVEPGSDEPGLVEQSHRDFEAWVETYVYPSFRDRAAAPVDSVINAVELRYRWAEARARLEKGEPPYVALEPLGNTLSSLQATPAAQVPEVDDVSQRVARLPEAMLDNAAVIDEIDELERTLQPRLQPLLDSDIGLRLAILNRDEQVLLKGLHEKISRLINEQSNNAEVRREEMRDVAKATQRLSWALPVLSLLLLGIVLWRTLVRIHRSVTTVNDAARRLASGDQGSRAEIEGDDEFAFLAKHFNRMAVSVEQRDKEAELLLGISELLQSCHDIREAFSLLANMGCYWFGAKGCLYLPVQSRTEYLKATCWGKSSDDLFADFGQEGCWALRLSRIYQSTQGQPARCEHHLKQWQRAVCIPLHAFGELVGVISLVWDETAEATRSNEYLGAAADHVSLSIANLQLRESLRIQTIRDPLTGIYNRRYMEEVFERELHRAMRNDDPLAVLLFDVDRFKQYNDTHGHDAGDAALRALGGLLQEFFRSEDSVFRFGGEEFLALLPNADSESASARAEQLRSEVEQMRILDDQRELPGITVSIGVAERSPVTRTPSDIVKEADAALYDAKKSGRNRVAFAPMRGSFSHGGA